MNTNVNQRPTALQRFIGIRGIQHVNTNVNQRPTALQRFIGEDAPARHAAAPQRLRRGEVDFAQRSVHHGLAQQLRIERKAVMEVICQHFARLAGSDPHLVGLLRRHGRRFFAHHMTAGLQRCHHMLKMESVWRTNAHHVRLNRLQHGARVLPRRRYGMALRKSLCLFEAAVHDSHHLNITARGVIRGMHFVRNLPGANDGDAQWRRC